MWSPDLASPFSVHPRQLDFLARGTVEEDSQGDKEQGISSQGPSQYRGWQTFDFQRMVRSPPQLGRLCRRFPTALDARRRGQGSNVTPSHSTLNLSQSQFLGLPKLHRRKHNHIPEDFLSGYSNGPHALASPRCGPSSDLQQSAGDGGLGSKTSKE
jgi:hypothetical protein